ncbi:MAG: gliding motility-associated protein GldE [Dysgonamonadaceae bacterium]|jgi:gliding motility-associated protein GldE|nr:gliding motility-associated protein GldE [Dysgonamonadaceae bacterium]
MDPDSILSFIISGIRTNQVSACEITALCISVFSLCLSALMSACEAAFLSLSSSKKSELEGEMINDAVVSLLQRPDRLLTTIMIWKNLANVSAVAFLGIAFNRILYPNNILLLGLLLEIIILATLILFCGEILPKIYMQNRALAFARKIAPFLNGLIRISSPISTPLLHSTRFVKQVSKKKLTDIPNGLLKTSKRNMEEQTEEKEMIEGIIGFCNKTASEIMTSRIDVTDLNINTGFHDVVRYIVEVGYSRIPVYADTTDNIKGILYMKDLLPYLDRHAEFCWQSLIRPAYFVPENKKINALLEEFQSTKTQMAVVIDEFGNTVGIVTMEDILEEIVGEINDEYDEDERKFIKLQDGSYIFDAKILLTDFFRETGIDPKVFGHFTGEVDTLAGLILEIKGNFPAKKEVISFEHFSFRILEIDRKRILKVKFSTFE